VLQRGEEAVVPVVVARAAVVLEVAEPAAAQAAAGHLPRMASSAPS